VQGRMDFMKKKKTKQNKETKNVPLALVR
jgi:hypothetical protein